MDREQTVWVTAHNSSPPFSRLDRFRKVSFTISASDYKVFFVCINYYLPKLLNVLHKVVIYLNRGRSSQVWHCRDAATLTDHAVGPVEFCPSFLNQHSPDLARVLRVSEAWQLGHRVARYVLIDNHFLLLSVDEEVNWVYSGWVYCLGIE